MAAAKALVNEIEESFFNLGGVLSHIYHEGLYKDAGYTGKKGFAEYSAAELGIDYRKPSQGLPCKWAEVGPMWP